MLPFMNRIKLKINHREMTSFNKRGNKSPESSNACIIRRSESAAKLTEEVPSYYVADFSPV